MDVNPAAPPSRWPLLVAIALALTAAGVQYARFLPDAASLWSDPVHDRNAHYLFGLSLALDVRQLDVAGLARDLNGARVWPPGHGLVLGTVLTATGYEPHFAVLPSLLAWAGMLVGVFVLAWRLAPSAGVVAGFAAMLLTMTSPSHRAFATDVMLESLGACLSVWAVERYVALRQTPSVGAVRSFALVLLALFLTKYNYWGLVVLGLAAADLATRPAAWLATGRQILAALPRGRQGWASLAPEVRVLAVWFVLPVAVWFCLPGRLSAFLWFSFTPHGEFPDFSLASRAGKFVTWFRTDYHAGVHFLVGVLALAGVAVVALRWLRPGALAVVVVLAVSAALTLNHPNSKARFLMSWMPALWVLAGVGLALVLPRRAAWQAAAVAVVAAVCLPVAATPGRVAEGGPRPGAPSLLPLADAYLAHVPAGERTAVLSTVPMKFFTQWSYLQARRPRRDRDLEAKGWLHLEAPNLDAFAAWLERTRCDRIVVLDVAKGSPFAVIPPGWTGDSVLSQWEGTQQLFNPGERVELPEVGTTIRVFERGGVARR